MSLLSATDGIPVGRFYDGNISQNILLKTSGYDQLDNVQLWNVMPDINTLTNESRVKDVLMSGADKKDLITGLTYAKPVNSVTDSLSYVWKDPVVYRYNAQQCYYGTNATMRRDTLLKIHGRHWKRKSRSRYIFPKDIP